MLPEIRSSHDRIKTDYLQTCSKDVHKEIYNHTSYEGILSLSETCTFQNDLFYSVAFNEAKFKVMLEKKMESVPFFIQLFLRHIHEEKTLQQKFKEFPECRQDRFAGLAMLKSLNIEGKVAIQKIKDGTVSINDTIQNQHETISKIYSILNDPTVGWDKKKNLQFTHILDSITNDSLTIDEALNLTNKQVGKMLEKMQLDARNRGEKEPTLSYITF